MNISSLQLKTVAAIVFVAANAASAARAQMPDAPALPSKSVHETIPLPPGPWSAPGNKVMVVTVKEPSVRHTCKVQALEPERLLCTERHHTNPTIYRAEDVAALIQPADPDHPWIWFGGILSVGGGIIAGACFLASLTIIGAIPVAIIGGLIVLASPVVFFGDSGPQHDTLLYQRDGTTLAVKFR